MSTTSRLVLLTPIVSAAALPAGPDRDARRLRVMLPRWSACQCCTRWFRRIRARCWRSLLVVLAPVLLIAAGQAVPALPTAIAAYLSWLVVVSNTVVALLVTTLMALPQLFGRPMLGRVLQSAIWSETMKPAGAILLAIGSGSIFFGHGNDPGFWLVKGYMGTDTAGTFRTWSVTETIVSVMG